MNNRWNIILIIFTVLFVGLIIAAVLSRRAPEQVIIIQPTPTPGPTITPAPTLSPPASDLIIINSPVPNQLISSPLTITGQARGNWFFEATAPVQLLDANGQQIAQGFITAQGDWQTTDLVPFTGTLNFSVPSTNTGQLVLQNNNPSGLAENIRQILIPVHFR